MLNLKNGNLKPELSCFTNSIHGIGIRVIKFQVVIVVRSSVLLGLCIL